jgi:lipopolysaccharide transport system ATP-binding protein
VTTASEEAPPRIPETPRACVLPALAARDLTKCYDRGPARVGRLLRELRDPALRLAARDVLWAVRDVSFELERGRSLGVIGRNGSGKSTLLRLLAGTARPTAGVVEVRSRLGCLLDLGVGFHPLETGRENAETSLVLIAGMTRREARRAVREVEAFAEIGSFFERPLRTYSAGMQLRLAFAVAARLSPEVLITDEVIAVGDASFQRKCERWFDAFLGRGGSLVLCAHDLSQVNRLCDRALWLDHGRPRELGPSRDVTRHYRESLGEEQSPAGADHEIGEASGMPCEVVDLHVYDEDGREIRSVRHGGSMVVVADVHSPAAVAQVCIGVLRDDLTPIYGVSSDMEDARPERLGPDRYRYRLHFTDLPLTAGAHRVRAHAMDETGTRLYDTVEIKLVVEGEEEPGLVRIAGDWRSPST